MLVSKYGETCLHVVAGLADSIPEVPAPATDIQLTNLTHLTLSTFPLGHEMIGLIVFHMPNLKDLCLAECMDIGRFPRTWASFFRQIAAGASNLRRLTLQYNRDDMARLRPREWLLTGGRYPEVLEVYNYLQAQDSRRTEMTEQEWLHRKRVLPYLWEVAGTQYGTLSRGSSETAKRFLLGDDHRALNELGAVLKSRGGEGVVHIPP